MDGGQEGGGPPAAGDGGGSFQRDPRKAERFFEHAQTTADSRQYDYAIECYVNGLRHDPDNIGKHESLYDLALKRKVAGGKPASLTERMKGGGKNPVDRMLHEERILAKNPVDFDQMKKVLKAAVEAAEAEPQLNIREYAHWIGDKLLAALQKNRKTDAKTLATVGDMMARNGSFAHAVHSYKLAAALRPGDKNLLQRLKDLEAEAAIHSSGYEESSKEEGGFRKVVKDLDKQKELEMADSLSKTEDIKEELVRRYRKDFAADREDLTLRLKLVKALQELESEDAEDEAIALLEEAYQQTQEYRLKVMIGDIRIRQMKRQLGLLKQAVDADPDDQAMRSEYEKLVAQRAAFELTEYTERVENYPTDAGLRFELGKRLMAAKQYDQAIAELQQAKNDPKYRAMAHDLLGHCYFQMGWHEEAIDTLKEGIEAHPLDDDRIALAMRYQLMMTQSALAKKEEDLELAKEAQKIASFILQKDIKYRDIRDRMNEIRSLVDELKKKD